MVLMMLFRGGLGHRKSSPVVRISLWELSVPRAPGEKRRSDEAGSAARAFAP